MKEFGTTEKEKRLGKDGVRGRTLVCVQSVQRVSVLVGPDSHGSGLSPPWSPTIPHRGEEPRVSRVTSTSTNGVSATYREVVDRGRVVRALRDRLGR